MNEQRLRDYLLGWADQLAEFPDDELFVSGLSFVLTCPTGHAHHTTMWSALTGDFI